MKENETMQREERQCEGASGWNGGEETGATTWKESEGQENELNGKKKTLRTIKPEFGIWKERAQQRVRECAAHLLPIVSRAAEQSY